MPLPHSPRAPVNIRHPEPTGICDRCSFFYPLDQLVWQMQWAGPRVINRKIRVCTRTCLDELQQNGFRSIVIGPDPKPLKDPRPPFWAQQEGSLGSGITQFVLDDEEAGVLDSGSVLG